MESPRGRDVIYFRVGNAESRSRGQPLVTPLGSGDWQDEWKRIRPGLDQLDLTEGAIFPAPFRRAFQTDHHSLHGGPRSGPVGCWIVTGMAVVVCPWRCYPLLDDVPAYKHFHSPAPRGAKPRNVSPLSIGHVALVLATAVCTAHANTQDLSQVPFADEAAKDVTADGFAFVELRTERASYFVGEPIHVAFRFGFDEELFKNNLIPLFRPSMDVPVQLEVPWLDQLPNATLQSESESAQKEGKSFVLNSGLTRARAVDDSRVDGRRLRSFEIERTWLATNPGELSLPQVRLRFAYATRFGERALQDNSAQDRVEAIVRSAARNLTILPLPESGRPAGFFGAVGRLTLRSEVSAREIDLNSSVKLTLSIEGDGNLESFEAPRFDPVEGWRMQGSVEHRSRRLRTIEYDLAPTSERSMRLPQVAFSYFDTTPPAGYRTLESEAIAITVRAPEKQAHKPSVTETKSAPSAKPRIWPYPAVIVVIIAVAVGRRRRRARK